jgi:hypothetical protein
MGLVLLMDCAAYCEPKFRGDVAFMSGGDRPSGDIQALQTYERNGYVSGKCEFGGSESWQRIVYFYEGLDHDHLLESS